MLPTSSSRLCGYFRSPVDELLDMVERGCRTFMTSGALVENSEEGTGRLDAAQKRQIVDAFNAAENAGGRADLHAIAERLGIHYSTVVIHTRALRAGRRREWRVKPSDRMGAET